MQFFSSMLHFISGNYVTDRRESFFSSLSTSPPGSSEEENLLKRLESGGAVEAPGVEGYLTFSREKLPLFLFSSVCANFGRQCSEFFETPMKLLL